MQAITATHPAAVNVAPSVLIIEDDSRLTPGLCQQLQQRGCQVEHCMDIASARTGLTEPRCDLVLLARHLPDGDGLALLKTLRAHSQIPVIMLSETTGEADCIDGLRAGADDYLRKPCNTTELMLRIEAVLRRTRGVTFTGTAELSFEGLQLNTQQGMLYWQGEALELTPTEFGILRQLMEGQGEVMSKAALYQEVMGRPWSRYDRSLDMHISKLRRKLTAVGFDASHLQTVHGQGYRLK